MSLSFQTPPDEPLGPNYGTLDLPSFDSDPPHASGWAWLVSAAVVAWGGLAGMVLLLVFLLHQVLA